MLVWIVAQDGTYIDEAELETLPKVGEQVQAERSWEVLEVPAPAEIGGRPDAQVIVVKS
jgi:hypothetical protein